MIYPTRRLAVVCAVPAALSLAVLIDDAWLGGLLLLDALIVAVALIDALAGLSLRGLSVTWDCPRTWSLGRTETVRFALRNHAPRARTLRAVADVPRALAADPPLTAMRVPAVSAVDVAVRLTPRARGSFDLAGLRVALPSALGLWVRHARLGELRTVHVYPNLKQLNEYALLARTNRLSLIGVRASRRVGGDTDFERLRDWRGDDAFNTIDWKATARRDVITAREYRTTQAQSLVLMIDAGRMMVSRAGGGGGASLLDHAIDAALMLGYVALSQGDRVGLIAYADGIARQIRVDRGMRQLGRLIHAVHDLHPQLVESRHEEAFLRLRHSERKRSLVVVLTHLLDDTSAEHLKAHVASLVGRHLPLVVLLQDPDLHGPLLSAPRDEDSFWRAGAAAHIVLWRARLIERLTAAGALVVDTPVERLTPGVVSEYLRVKAMHLL